MSNNILERLFRRRLVWFGFVALLGGCVAVLTSTATAAGSQFDSSAPPPIHLEASELTEEQLEAYGIDLSMATDPWRVEQFDDGTIRMVFGPGLVDVPLNERSTLIVEGVPAKPVDFPSTASVRTTNLAWYCNVDTYFDTVHDSKDLRTAYDVDCYHVARHRVDWKFQRSSWSGYRDYTTLQEGGWLSAGNRNAQTVRARCWPPSEGGVYDYRGLVISVVEPTIGDTRLSPGAATIKGRHRCGTGVS